VRHGTQNSTQTVRKALTDAGKSALQVKRKATAQNKSKKFKIIQRQSKRNLTGESNRKQSGIRAGRKRHIADLMLNSRPEIQPSSLS
jgi:hypothetical protein